MRQVKRIFVLMLALALTLTMTNAIPISAETTALTAADFVNVPVTKTELISSITGTTVSQSAAGHFIDNEKGSHSYFWQFTLEDSAMITISTCANLFTYNFIGESTLWLGTDTQCSSKIVTDHIGTELDNQRSSSWNKATSMASSIKLPAKGSYYITVSSERFIFIDLTATWEDVVVKPIVTLTVKKVKKNAKKVSGISIAGASIKVKVGKKTYKGIANTKGKFTVKTKKIKKDIKVKVTASLAGYKTKSKTVKTK